MGTIKHMTAPFRSIVRFPLFQLAIVVALILFLQAADPASALGRIFTGLDRLVSATVELFANLFDLRLLHPIMAHVGFLDWLCLSCLPADPVSGAAGHRRHCRSCRTTQCVLAAQRHRARARHCRLPRLGAVRENPAATHSAARLGRDLCLARRQQAALSAARAAPAGRHRYQCDRDRGGRRGVAISDAVSGFDLAWPVGNAIVWLSAPLGHARRRAKLASSHS